MLEELEVSAGADAERSARSAMWEMITAYRVSQMARVAAELSLAEHCADAPVSARRLAELESTDPVATARFLRACVSIGLMSYVDGDRFASTPLLQTLRRDAPESLRGFALSLPAAGHWLPWEHLLEAVRTGADQVPTTLGDSLWTGYYAKHPEEAAAFTEGLLGMTAVAGAAAAKAIDTAGVQLAVDVGGASGDLLHSLMRVNPRLQGVVFDLPHVADDALAAAAREGLRDRVRVESGDFFNAVPAGADLYLLRYILHDWDDDDCVRILENCRRAMSPGGRVLVLEMILGEIGNEPAAVPSQDLNMLVMTGGRERTIDQFDQLFRASGLRRTTTTETGSPMSVIEAVAVPGQC